MRSTGLCLPAAALAAAAFAAAPAFAEDCTIPDSERDALLGQDFHTFDQSPEGWRQYARSGCNLLAGKLIERYLAESGPPANRRHLLHFHAGQTFAGAGRTERALGHFRQSFKEENDEIVDWNSYVRATIAFLERDRDTVEAMREKLREQPVLTREAHPGLPEHWIGKRANIGVVEGFLACWNKPYQDAYASDCRERYRTSEGQADGR